MESSVTVSGLSLLIPWQLHFILISSSPNDSLPSFPLFLHLFTISVAPVSPPLNINFARFSTMFAPVSTTELPFPLVFNMISYFIQMFLIPLKLF